MKYLVLYRPDGGVSSTQSLRPYIGLEGDADAAMEARFYAEQGAVASAHLGLPFVIADSWSEGYVDVHQDPPAFRAFPERPSPVHVWDWPTLRWLANTDAAAAQATKRIERARAAATVAPIVYDGKRLDADEVSQTRLANQVTVVAECEARGETMPLDRLFWRDADNITHLWPSHAAYRDWLGGFVLALGARTSDSMVWAWTQKAKRDAAIADGDVAALEALPETPVITQTSVEA